MSLDRTRAVVKSGHRVGFAHLDRDGASALATVTLVVPRAHAAETPFAESAGVQADARGPVARVRDELRSR